jgi:hypothetical protein
MGVFMVLKMICAFAAMAVLWLSGMAQPAFRFHEFRKRVQLVVGVDRVGTMRNLSIEFAEYPDSRLRGDSLSAFYVISQRGVSHPPRSTVVWYPWSRRCFPTCIFLTLKSPNMVNMLKNVPSIVF